MSSVLFPIGARLTAFSARQIYIYASSVFGTGYIVYIATSFQCGSDDIRVISRSVHCTISYPCQNELGFFQVMMAAVTRQLTELHEKNKDGREILFEEYVATMLQNPIIEKDYDGEIFRNEYKQFSKFGVARGEVDKQVVSILNFI